MASIEDEMGSEDFFTGVVCDLCPMDKMQNDAQSYCINCNEFMCEMCSGVHRSSSASRSHEFLNEDEMPKRKLTSLELEERNCHKHVNSQVGFYCTVHSVFLCTTCFLQDHKQCDVASVDVLAEDYKTSEEYKDLLKDIGDIENELAKNKKNAETNRDRVNACFDRMLEDIKTFRGEINIKLDEMETRLIDEAKQVQSDDLNSLNLFLKSSQTNQMDLNNMHSSLADLEKYRQNMELVISSKKARSRIDEYQKEIKKMSERIRIRTYSFKRNEEVLKSLLSTLNLGILDYKEDEEERRYREKDEQDNVDTLQPNTDPKPRKATYVKKINIKHKKDWWNGKITDSVLLTNDTLALTDRYNYSVKIVDLKSDMITAYIVLPDKTHGIACVTPSELIVTRDKKLTFLKYDKTLSIVKDIPMEEGCRGIAYCNNKIFVTFTKQPAVKILDTDGKVLKTFRNLFEYPEYIILSDDGQSMYVSDSRRNTVTSLNMDGHVIKTYKHVHLRGPRGMAVDGNNSIYVVGRDSRNVHQITSQFRHVQIALEHNDLLSYFLSNARTLLYNNTTNTLYMSSDRGKLGGGVDMLVFKLE